MIFDEAGSSLSPNISAIIVGSIQLVGVYMSTLLVDKAGRKFLMVSSAFCSALGLALFGVYDYMKHHDMDLTERHSWIPLASFSFVIFVANLGKALCLRMLTFELFIIVGIFASFAGVVSLPFLVLTEVAPIKIKDIVYSINLSLSWLLAFFALQVIATFCTIKIQFNFFNWTFSPIFFPPVSAFEHRRAGNLRNNVYLCSELLRWSHFHNHLCTRNEKQELRRNTRNYGEVNECSFASFLSR